jgi:L,D-transpeptidase ErfK/SrfK
MLIRGLTILVFLILTYSAIPLVPTYAATYEPMGDGIGTVSYYTVKKGDNLYEIARRQDLGIVELLAANPGVDPWTPEIGHTLTLTTAHVLPLVRQGIVLNLSELRLFYFTSDGKVLTFPIGIGREGWQTPLGETTIVKKRKDPVWIPPDSIRAENPDLPEKVLPGPENPMGAYALNLGWPGYAIHGTNRPYGIGKRSSHGCIRLYPEDITRLFQAVEIGTPVTVIDTPYKLGWQGAYLYLEVTPTQRQSDAIAEYRRPTPPIFSDVYDRVRIAAGDETDIDWYAVDKAVAAHDGVPAIIGKNPNRK